MIRLLFVIFSLIMFLSNPLAGQSIRVMSYNIRYDNPGDGLNVWNNRKEFLATQILRADPDILGIQESLPNQVEYLSSTLSEFAHVGEGRDEGGQGESTTIFYRKEQFDLLAYHTFWLSETPDKISTGWDAAIRRICTYAWLFDKKSQRGFLILNTHFDHVGPKARLQSARLILRKMKELNPKVLPVILIGDFNATPESEPIQTFNTELREARRIAETKLPGPEGSFNGFGSDTPATQLIDHVFVSSGTSVQKYSVLQASRESRYPSDHFPVVVELNLPKTDRK